MLVDVVLDEAIMRDVRALVATGRHICRLGVLASVLGLGLAGIGSSALGDDSKPSDKRTVVAKSAAPLGMLVSRDAPGNPWKLVPLKGDVTSGDLLIGLPGAMLVSK